MSKNTADTILSAEESAYLNTTAVALVGDYLVNTLRSAGVPNAPGSLADLAPILVSVGHAPTSGSRPVEEKDVKRRAYLLADYSEDRVTRQTEVARLFIHPEHVDAPSISLSVLEALIDETYKPVEEQRKTATGTRSYLHKGHKLWKAARLACGLPTDTAKCYRADASHWKAPKRSKEAPDDQAREAMARDTFQHVQGLLPESPLVSSMERTVPKPDVQRSHVLVWYHPTDVGPDGQPVILHKARAGSKQAATVVRHLLFNIGTPRKPRLVSAVDLTLLESATEEPEAEPEAATA